MGEEIFFLFALSDFAPIFVSFSSSIPRFKVTTGKSLQLPHEIWLADMNPLRRKEEEITKGEVSKGI